MPKKSKKAAIIDTATVLFAGKGFTNTSMTEVASLTGIVGATIFYHFKTKEELFVSVLENVKTGLVQAFSLYFQEEHFPSGLETAARGDRLPPPSVGNQKRVVPPFTPSLHPRTGGGKSGLPPSTSKSFIPAWSRSSKRPWSSASRMVRSDRCQRRRPP